MTGYLTPREQRSAAIMAIQEIYAQGPAYHSTKQHGELAKLQRQLDEAEKRLAENAN